MSTFADTEPPPSLLSLPTDISLHILALGAERAKWGTVPLCGDAARDELDADFDRPDDKRSEVRRAENCPSRFLPGFLRPYARIISY